MGKILAGSVQHISLQKSRWDEYGESNGFTKLKSWPTKLAFKFPEDLSFWATPDARNYFQSFLSHNPEDMQEDIASSLTATGVISVLVLSIAVDSFEDPMDDKAEDNLWGDDASPYVSGICQVCGVLSFLFAAMGTFFTVNFFSQVVRVPVEAFPAFIEASGSGVFGCIWAWPGLSVFFYIAAIIIKATIVNSMWFGITAIALTVILILTLIRTHSTTDILHAKLVIIHAKCLEEKQLSDKDHQV